MHATMMASPTLNGVSIVADVSEPGMDHWGPKFALLAYLILTLKSVVWTVGLGRCSVSKVFVVWACEPEFDS